MKLGGLPLEDIARIKKVGYNQWWIEKCAICSDFELDKVEKESTIKFNFEMGAIDAERKKRNDLKQTMLGVKENG